MIKETELERRNLTSLAQSLRELKHANLDIDISYSFTRTIDLIKDEVKATQEGTKAVCETCECEKDESGEFVIKDGDYVPEPSLKTKYRDLMKELLDEKIKVKLHVIRFSKFPKKFDSDEKNYSVWRPALFGTVLIPDAEYDALEKEDSPKDSKKKTDKTKVN